MKRIVIKIGSNILTREDGNLDTTRISSIADQVVAIRNSGCQVLLVTSGAVACGRGIFNDVGRHDNIPTRLDTVQQRQLYSAVGQVELIGIYSRLFSSWNVRIGQVLTMKENFSTRREYLNQRSCMETMLANDVIPIINENDTISVTELMFTDNDELSGLVASMMDADTLIILSNVDGIYNGSPEDRDSQVIRKIRIEDDLSKYICNEKSRFGRGGMLTKSSIARKAADEGIRVIIANGTRPDIIKDLYYNPDNTLCTEFVPKEGGYSSIKKWIAHSKDFTKGAVYIDDNARKILLGDKAVSLLPVGVLRIEGDFEEGDIINILDANGEKIAIGKSSYSAKETQLLLGKHDCRPLVSYDYLFLV